MAYKFNSIKWALNMEIENLNNIYLTKVTFTKLLNHENYSWVLFCLQRSKVHFKC